MKNVLILLQLTSLFSSSQNCEYTYLAPSFKVIKQWWINTNNNHSYNNIPTHQGLDETLYADYQYKLLCSKTYYKNIAATGSENEVLMVENTKDMTLSFPCNTNSKFGGIKMNNSCIESIEADAFTDFLQLIEI